MALDWDWKIYCDLNNDGDYSDADEDLSPYFSSANWQLGFAKAYDPIARDATGAFNFLNHSGKFSPERTSHALAGLTKGRRVKLTLTALGITRTMTVLKVEDIRPAPDQWGPKTAQLPCVGFMNYAQRDESFVPVQEGKTADQVIDAILTHSGVFPPGLPLRWLLGVSGWGELDTNAYLAGMADYLTAETGMTTFGYIGDKWADGVSVLGALRDTVGREMGRLFQNRDGLLQFWNRHHLILDTDTDETFDNSMSGLDYGYGREVVNRVTVKAHPRRVGTTVEVLGVINGPVKVLPGETLTVTFRYGDPVSSFKFAGKNALTPVANTDYTARVNEDGTGDDLTANLSAVIGNQTATKCEVLFTNSAGVEAWIQPGAQIRGTRITDYGETSVTRQDEESIGQYGLRPLVYPFVMDNVADATGIAEYIRATRKDPRGDIASVTLRPLNPTLLQAMATRTIGDRIRLVEKQTGAAADYFIIGEQHQIRAQDNFWQVTWQVEPASGYVYWVLGVSGFSELDSSAILGPL